MRVLLSGAEGWTWDYGGVQLKMALLADVIPCQKERLWMVLETGGPPSKVFGSSRKSKECAARCAASNE
jgi:hypothetical protein